MKYCTNCGKKLVDEAAYCLNCGKKVEGGTIIEKTNKPAKKGMPAWGIILIVIFGLLIVTGIVFAIIGTTVYEEAETQENLNGTLGDTLTGNKFKITLESSKVYSEIQTTNEYYTNIPDEGKMYLLYFIEVENITNEEQYFSIYNWNSYADGYATTIAYIIGDVEGNSIIGGELAPGMKAKGFVAFEIPAEAQTFQASYKEDYYSSSKQLQFNVTIEK